MPTFHHYVSCSPGPEPAWDQPNRAVRTRMLRGVGGGSRETPPYIYPYRLFFIYVLPCIRLLLEIKVQIYLSHLSWQIGRQGTANARDDEQEPS